MPVDKNGRWVSPARFKAMLDAEKAVDTPADDAEPAIQEPKAKRSRRPSKKAAEAAIANATGVQVDVNDTEETITDDETA